MSSDFADHAGGLESPLSRLEDVTLGTDFTFTSRALFVGTGGDVTVTPLRGATVTLRNVPDGAVLPIRAIRVETAGTTASDIVAGE